MLATFHGEIYASV